MAQVLKRSLIVSFLVGVAACAGSPDSRDQVPPNAISTIRVAESGLPLPHSAENVWQYEARFQDGIQLLRFDAPLSDARSFAFALFRKNPVPGEDPNLRSVGTNREWWLREFPAHAAGASDQRDGIRRLIVILPRGRRARVWLAITGW